MTRPIDVFGAGRHFLVVALCMLSSFVLADDQEKFDVNSPVDAMLATVLHQLGAANAPSTIPSLPPLDQLNQEPPFQLGTIHYSNAKELVRRLVPSVSSCGSSAHSGSAPSAGTTTPTTTAGEPPVSDCDRVTIIHVLRWADKDHKTTKFQRWYLHDPLGHSRAAFDLASNQGIFE